MSAQTGAEERSLKSKVVIALSASPSSAHALQWAADNILDVAKHTVVLISVIEAPVEAGYYFDSAVTMYNAAFIDEMFAKAQENAAAVVRDAKALLRERFGESLLCETAVAKGDVRDEIVDCVESCGADLLIIGSRGLGAIKRAFLGSTSDYCVHHCHCPVVIVKMPPSAKGAASHGKGSEGKKHAKEH